MKSLVIVAATVLLFGPALAADVSGTWNLEMRWPGDRQATGVCTFEQDGRKLSGKCGGDDKFAITGQIDDKRLTWEFDVEQNGSRGHMVFSGELDDAGTTINGSCSIVGAQDGTFAMTKKQ
jgi:hypothetical protein